MDPLDRMRRSSQKVASTKFENSGSFTNAMEWRPEITKLIRDAHPSERALYRVAKASGATSSVLHRSRRQGGEANDDSAFESLRPERTDGKPTLADRIERINENVSTSRPASSGAMPENSDSSSPSRRRSILTSNLISQQALESDDVEVFCDAMLRAVDSHKGYEDASATRSTALEMKQEYSTMLHDIQVLEQTVTQQKEHLDRHEEEDFNVSPIRGNLGSASSHSVPELIQQEEKVILELESQLKAAMQENQGTPAL